MNIISAQEAHNISFNKRNELIRPILKVIYKIIRDKAEQGGTQVKLRYTGLDAIKIKTTLKEQGYKIGASDTNCFWVMWGDI